MKNYHVQCKPDSNDHAAFCTSSASPEDNRQRIKWLAKRVDDFFHACGTGLYSPECLDDPGYVKNFENYWVHVAVTDVLVSRHFGISTDVMLSYVPPQGRATVNALANEVPL